jgi:hypothetical protein
MNRLNQRTLDGDVAGSVVITLPQGIELPAGDCGKFTVAETHQRELGQKRTFPAVQRGGSTMPFGSLPSLKTSANRNSFKVYAYFRLTSRRSLVRRSSYSSLVISPAAYLLCRSCSGDCICR